MINTMPVRQRRATLLASVLTLALQGTATASEAILNEPESKPMPHATKPSDTSQTLTARQQAIIPIAAFAAVGDLARLNEALNQGLDAGLTINDSKEILSQLYAYAGFPRSLNALGELMTVLDMRKQRGVTDAPGKAPSHDIPTGEAL